MTITTTTMMMTTMMTRTADEQYVRDKREPRKRSFFIGQWVDEPRRVKRNS